jgi:hypothetical protein
MHRKRAYLLTLSEARSGCLLLLASQAVLTNTSTEMKNGTSEEDRNL